MPAVSQSIHYSSNRKFEKSTAWAIHRGSREGLHLFRIAYWHSLCRRVQNAPEVVIQQAIRGVVLSAGEFHRLQTRVKSLVGDRRRDAKRLIQQRRTVMIAAKLV